MKKALKIIRDIALWTIAIVILALVTFPLWIGVVARTAANIAVPKVTGTEFSMDRFVLNPYTGRFEVGGVLLANPAGYKEPNAVTVGKLTVLVDTPSLLSDVIHVKDITLDGASVSYLSGGKDDVNNFKQIQYNAAGGKEAYEAAEAEKKAQEAQEPKHAEPAPEPAPKKEKRFIIDHVKVTGVRVRLGLMSIPVPTLELTDIGKKSGGATALEACQCVLNAALESCADLANGIGSLVSGLGEGALKVGGEAVKLGEDAGKALKSLGTEGGKALDEGLKKTTEGVKNLKNLIKF